MDNNTIDHVPDVFATYPIRQGRELADLEPFISAYFVGYTIIYCLYFSYPVGNQVIPLVDSRPFYERIETCVSEVGIPSSEEPNSFDSTMRIF